MTSEYINYGQVGAFGENAQSAGNDLGRLSVALDRSILQN